MPISKFNIDENRFAIFEEAGSDTNRYKVYIDNVVVIEADFPSSSIGGFSCKNECYALFAGTKLVFRQRKDELCQLDCGYDILAVWVEKEHIFCFTELKLYVLNFRGAVKNTRSFDDVLTNITKIKNAFKLEFWNGSNTVISIPELTHISL